jgi:hypothetical protein
MSTLYIRPRRPLSFPNILKNCQQGHNYHYRPRPPRCSVLRRGRGCWNPFQRHHDHRPDCNGGFDLQGMLDVNAR